MRLWLFPVDSSGVTRARKERAAGERWREGVRAVMLGAALGTGAVVAGPLMAAPTVGGDEYGPEVRILAPGYQDVLRGSTRIVMAVKATRFNPQFVEMFVDDKPATDGPIPLSAFPSTSFDWDTRLFADGPHKLTVRVTDTQGFRGWAEVHVFIRNNRNAPNPAPPALRWKNVENFATIAGQAHIEVESVENFGVKWVLISINPASSPDAKPPLRSWLLSRAPYAVKFDSLAVPDGLYTLSARAYDALDQQGDAPALSIAVVNNSVNATSLGDLIGGLAAIERGETPPAARGANARVFAGDTISQRSTTPNSASPPRADSPAVPSLPDLVPMAPASSSSGTGRPTSGQTPAAPPAGPTPKVEAASDGLTPLEPLGPAQTVTQNAVRDNAVRDNAVRDNAVRDNAVRDNAVVASPAPALVETDPIIPALVEVPSAAASLEGAASLEPVSGDDVAASSSLATQAERSSDTALDTVASPDLSERAEPLEPETNRVARAESGGAISDRSSDQAAWSETSSAQTKAAATKLAAAPELDATSKSQRALLTARPQGLTRETAQTELVQSRLAQPALAERATLARASAATQAASEPALASRIAPEPSAGSRNATVETASTASGPMLVATRPSATLRPEPSPSVASATSTAAPLAAPEPVASKRVAAAPALAPAPMSAPALAERALSAPAPFERRLAERTQASRAPIATANRDVLDAPRATTPQAVISREASRAQTATSPTATSPTATSPTAASSGATALAAAPRNSSGAATSAAVPSAVTPSQSAPSRRAAITATPLESSVARRVPGVHRVERLTTLRAVAARYGLAPDLVAAANGRPVESSLAPGTLVQLPRPIEVALNGAVVDSDAPSMLIGSTGVTAFRFLFEQAGGTLVWDAANGRVLARKADTEIVLTIGSNVARVNDRDVMMELAAFLYEGRTMVPIRLFEEGLRAHVEWNPRTGRLVVAMQNDALAH